MGLYGTDYFLLEGIARSDIQSKYLEKGDVCYNLNNWDKNGYNILFITGISGSGKTTLGTDLATEFKIPRVELDYISFYYLRKAFEKGKHIKMYDLLKQNCPEAAVFIDQNPIEKYGLRDNFADTIDIVKDFCNWFLNKYEGTNKLYIINGSHIINIYHYSFFKDRPIILKDINLIKTIIRRTCREFEIDRSFLTNLEKMYKAFKCGLSKEYLNANKLFKQYRSDLNNIAYKENSLIDF